MQLRRSGALLATSLSISMAIGLSVFVAYAPSGLAPAAYAADAATVSAEDFLKSYYTAMSKIKGPKDIEPFLSEKVKGKMPPDDISDPKMVGLFLEMIHSTQPTKVKVVSKKEEKDR